GSALAEAALEYAQEIVDPEGQITLVTAVELDDLPAYGPSMMPLVRTSIPDYQDAVDNLMPQANAYLQRVADRLQMRGREVTYEVRIGHPAEVIVDVAREQNVDAIVISTHGRSRLGR